MNNAIIYNKYALLTNVFIDPATESSSAATSEPDLNSASDKGDGCHLCNQLILSLPFYSNPYMKGKQ